ncbi:hypothetical protein Cni_G06130 [Canna indica]|uniref:Uncharacterized protein n=1 Tax=Canna indica TaxID=4628 RepID=A0AAQ3JWF9_9LILI|nr:hypothetical protein Cni_G06130 [Canna indica]
MIILSFYNISSSISWGYLHNVSALRILDLSDYGSMPRSLRSSALLQVNLTTNHLGCALLFGSLKSSFALVSLNRTSKRRRPQSPASPHPHAAWFREDEKVEAYGCVNELARSVFRWLTTFNVRLDYLNVLYNQG